MLLASRDIIGGIEWVKAHAGEENIAKTAEKQKKMFAGQEIEGKKLGVIGLGAIGVLVANAALHLGMEVYGYDPYMSVDSAWNLSRHIHHVKNLETIYQECDYITLHVPALDDTKGMIDREAAGQMKDGVILLNFARDLLVKKRSDRGTGNWAHTEICHRLSDSGAGRKRSCHRYSPSGCFHGRV